MTPDWITSLDSYAIPTMHGGVDAVKPYVDEFIEYAKQHVLKRIFLENLQSLEEHGQEDDDAVWT